MDFHTKCKIFMNTCKIQNTGAKLKDPFLIKLIADTLLYLIQTLAGISTFSPQSQNPIMNGEFVAKWFSSRVIKVKYLTLKLPNPDISGTHI